MAIYGQARLGKMRLKAFRLGYALPVVKILIGGVDRTNDVRLEALTITDELNHEPNNASFRAWAFTPTKGQSVSIVVGGQQLFGGHILSLQSLYEGGVVTNLAWDCHCIDYTWLLNRRKVIKKYTNQSATAILQDLIASFTSGFTTAHVELGLAVLDEITFTNEDVTDALTRVIERIGGYWFADYSKDLHAFVTTGEAAGSITQAAPRTMMEIQQNADLSQVATRVTVRGGGSTSAGDVAVGASALPVEDASWYVAPGVVECGPQRIGYIGVQLGGGGSVVAGRAAVAGAPAAAVGAAGVLVAGTYQYKTTFVIGDGETAPSAAGSVTVTNVAAPTTSPSLVGNTGGALTPNKTYRYYVAFVTATGETLVGPSIFIILNAVQTMVVLSAIPTSADSRVIARKIYRVDPDQTLNKLLTTINDNVTTGYADVTASGGLGAEAPTADTGSGKAQIAISSLAIGPAGTTARRLYRTAVGGSVFQRVATVSDNTATTLTDNVADTARGPEVDAASGAPALAGDVALPVFDLAPFPAAGLVWVGSQLVSYTGRSGSSGPGTLTGIPAAGVGALLAPAAVGAEVIVAAHLSGCTGLVYAINKGDPVNVVVTVNDAAAQAVMAALVGGDGITEYFITDGRWSVVECTARGTAELTKRKDPLLTITFDSRDPTLVSGRAVTITLTSPAITGTFTIQRVTFSEIGIFPVGDPTWPLRHVECSSTRYSFEDLLRQIKGKAA